MNEKFILTLIDKFNSINIDELDLNDGSTRLVLRRGCGPSTIGSSGNNDDGSQSGKSIHLGMPASVSAGTSPESHGDGEKITSPIVATFYSAPGPDAPAFVKPGSKVKAGQTLCILEAMKMMNHLEADFDCEVIEIHAANGDLVEYDQALFSVKRL